MTKCKRVMLVLMAAVFAFSFAGCNKNRDSNTIVFCTYGSDSELSVYVAMVNEFNATYGKEHGISVKHTPVASANYNSYITSMSTARDSYDVFLVIEDNFKRWTNMGFVADMTAHFAAVTDIDTSDVFENTVDRLRLNLANNTSNKTDPLYGLPLDTKPSAIYYNESMFEKAGIIVISVDEKDMDAWNAGEIADKRGKKKSDFAKLTGVTVPKKGYYRSRFPYVADRGGVWSKPENNETLVFNNRIPMNWDELEDLAMLFSPSQNPSAKSQFGNQLEYGMFTEWWFNYGWSVGGNCLQDLSGNGDWNFSLLDSTPNYIVTGDSYTGAYTGKTYAKGETLEFNDKFNVPQGKVMTPDENGGYTLDGAPVGIRPAVQEAANGGTLSALPSVRDAFTRYLRLGTKSTIEGKGGLGISPNPMTFNNRTRQNYWFSQAMAMLIDYSTYIEVFSREAESHGFTWDVAPLPVYKEYVSPMEPSNDAVKVVGKHAGECNSKAMLVRERSIANKDACARFVSWMASKQGQSVRAAEGHFPNQRELLDKIQFKGYAPRNVTVFSEALEYQGAGDWWYLPDDAWIQVWANPLNSEVRNGTKTYDSWKGTAIADTNRKLLEY